LLPLFHGTILTAPSSIFHIPHSLHVSYILQYLLTLARGPRALLLYNNTIKHIKPKNQEKNRARRRIKTEEAASLSNRRGIKTEEQQ